MILNSSLSNVLTQQSKVIRLTTKTIYIYTTYSKMWLLHIIKCLAIKRIVIIHSDIFSLWAINHLANLYQILIMKRNIKIRRMQASSHEKCDDAFNLLDNIQSSFNKRNSHSINISFSNNVANVGCDLQGYHREIMYTYTWFKHIEWFGLLSAILQKI